MDLRPYLNRNDPVRASLFERGVSLIQQGEFWYQPFILADGLEVGEGQNLQDEYRNCASLFDNNVFLSEEHRHYWANNPRKLASDGDYFSSCNRKYRYCYELITNTIVSRMGDISNMSFLELGCNTGLNLFNLAARGAGACTGVDWTNHSAVVGWLNDVLGTNVSFLQGSYDNLTHTIPNLEVPQSDVVINTVFLNHQCDPIQVLCYLADRAKKGLFLWVLLDENRGDELAVRYGQVSGIHDLGAGKPLPLSFHNDVRMSSALLTTCLRQLGFGKSEFIDFPAVEDDLMTKSLRAFRMVWAERTEDRPSGYASRQDLFRQDQLQNKLKELELEIKELELEKSMLRSSIEDGAKRLVTLEDELSIIRNSYSFRIGRMATAPIRIIRNALAGLANRD